MKEIYTQKEAMALFDVGRDALGSMVKKKQLVNVGTGISRASIEALLGHPVEETVAESTGQPTGLSKKQDRLAEFKVDKELEDWEGRAKEAEEIIGKAEENATLIIHKANEKAEGFKSEAQARLSEAREAEKAMVDREDKVNIATDKIEGQLKLLAERAKAVKEGESSLSTQKSQFKAERNSVRSREYVAPRPQASTPQEPEKNSLLPENWRTWVFGAVVALVVIWWLIAEATCSKGG